MFDSSGYNLRNAQFSDADTILMWRNTERVFRYSYDNNPVARQAHLVWFGRALEDPRVVVYVFEDKSRPLGLIHFKFSESSEVHWSFYIGENDAPRGAGAVMANMAIAKMFADYGSSMKIVGEVLIENTISRRFHEKLGFVSLGQTSKFVAARNCEVAIETYALAWKAWQQNLGIPQH